MCFLAEVDPHGKLAGVAAVVFAAGFLWESAMFLSDVVSWREDEEQKQKRKLKVQLDTKPDLQLQHLS